MKVEEKGNDCLRRSCQRWRPEDGELIRNRERVSDMTLKTRSDQSWGHIFARTGW